MKLGIRVNPNELQELEKAFSHKYLRRIPKKNGKGYWYIYAETFQKPLNALNLFFGLQTKSISDTYEKNDINKDYGTDKEIFAAHLLEYLTNKLKWDNFFSSKGNREKYIKPEKHDDVTAAASNVKNDTPGLIVNRSLMRKVWEIYNLRKSKGSGKDYDNNDQPVKDTSTYEGKIATCFLPWLKDDITDGAWQSLSSRVANIIREIQNGSK
jgi:hypothetical protein